VRVFSGHSRGDSAHRSLWRGVKKAKMEVQRIAGEREHIAQLAAAENSDDHLRFPFLRPEPVMKILAGSGTASTFLVCEARNFRSDSRMAGYLLPSAAAASRAALIAPAFPMASEPTGIPAGICAMESKESSPFNAFDSTGTPKTGSTVFDAVIPGK